MSIQILNNISSLVAENAVSNTQTNLNNTLQQLSTGLKINSGADDPAGLSIADGLGANISALTQSSQNASNGVGLLQTADGALSQVTTILNQAVTIATEAGNGGLTNSQSAALNTEFQSILQEINQIGSTTNFNGTSVFNGAANNSVEGSVGALTGTSTLTLGSTTTIADSKTGGTFVFTATAGNNTIADLSTAIGNAVTAGTLSAGTGTSFSATGQLVIATTTAGDSLTVNTSDPVLGAGTFQPTAVTGGSTDVFTSDGSGTGFTNTTTAINALSSTSLGLNTNNLSTTASAQTALTAVTAAISSIAAQRGNIGASINQLTADSGVENTEVQNLTSAQNNVQNADIATVTSNLTQFNILEQTGFDALSQSSSAEQNVLKLLQ
jgi:flagellin